MRKMQKSRTITIFLIDWNPTWFRKIYLNNRLTLGFFISRKDLDKAKNRDEFTRSWVYFLLWKDEEDKNLVYIWQTWNLLERVKQHHNDIKKDFWNSAIIFTTDNWSWNESDLNFLEKNLIEDAKKLWNYIIKNSQSWNTWLIKEERMPDLEENIDDIKILISSLWFSIFKEKTSKEDKKEKYFCQRNWNNGVWYYTKEWFLVLKWSVWSFEIKEYALSALKNIQQKLFLENILKQENEKIIFLQDYLFSSPSTASSIIIWNKSNGWIDWKTENWKTLHEIERKNKNI